MFLDANRMEKLLADQSELRARLIMVRPHRLPGSPVRGRALSGRLSKACSC